MLDRLQRIARRFYWLRPLSIALGLAAFLAAIFLLVQPDKLLTEEWFIPALLLFCWAVLLYSFLGLFLVVPRRLHKPAPWRLRFASGTLRALLYGLGVALLVLTGALVLVSFKLLNTGIGV